METTVAKLLIDMGSVGLLGGVIWLLLGRVLPEVLRRNAETVARQHDAFAQNLSRQSETFERSLIQQRSDFAQELSDMRRETAEERKADREAIEQLSRAVIDLREEIRRNR